jgi:hypothetical protein
MIYKDLWRFSTKYQMNHGKNRLFSRHVVRFHPAKAITPCKTVAYNIPYPELTFNR